MIEEAEDYDIYHLHAYHRLAEIQGEGAAVLIVYRESGCVVALPLLVRCIDLPGVCSASEGWRDATSLRGMVGPVASCRPSAEVIVHFQDALQDYFRQNKIVSAYARLHPWVGRPEVLDGLGQTVPVATAITLDLTVPPDEQVARYRRDHRHDVRKLARDGFVCEQAGEDCLDDFMHAYRDTMNRVQAAQEYYVERWCFDYLMREMPETVRLFICRDPEGKLASAGLVGASRRVVHGLYAGTAPEYRRQSPSKLMLDTVRQWGCEIGAELFHLGGAVGDRRDSLYDYKMGFGGVEHSRSTWRLVVDRTVYDELCQEAHRQSAARPEPAYFPAYRWTSPA